MEGLHREDKNCKGVIKNVYLSGDKNNDSVESTKTSVRNWDNI